jgi:hypothetical protein
MSNIIEIANDDKTAKVYNTIATFENFIFPIKVPNGMLNKRTGKNIEK